MFYLIIFILILIKIFPNSNTKKEKFKGHYKDTKYNIFNDLSNSLKRNCCLVSKKFDKKNQRFYYDYKKLKPSICNPENHVLENNKSILFSSNDFSENFCKAKHSLLGSCRRLNFECNDFVMRKDCPKEIMDWNPLPCEYNIYKLNLKSNLNKLPKYEDERLEELNLFRKSVDENDTKYKKLGISFSKKIQQ